jgi:hypothetical protein
MSVLLSQSAYARRRGCSQQHISKLVQQGRISLINGKIDPTKADQEIEQTADPLHPKNRKQNTEANERYENAQAARLFNDTRLRRLKIEISQGKWLPKADLNKIAFDTGHIMRDAIFAILDRHDAAYAQAENRPQAIIEIKADLQKLFNETKKRMIKQVYRSANKLSDQTFQEDEGNDDE